MYLQYNRVLDLLGDMIYLAVKIILKVTLFYHLFIVVNLFLLRDFQL